MATCDQSLLKLMKTLRFAKRCCVAGIALWLAAVPAFAQPVISTPPQSQTVRVGSAAFFTVAATGTPPLTYQWRNGGMDIPEAIGASCTLGLARTDQAGAYTVVVSNSAGSVTSTPPAVLTVTPVPPGVVFGQASWGGEWYVPAEAQSEATAIAAGYFHDAVTDRKFDFHGGEPMGTRHP